MKCRRDLHLPVIVIKSHHLPHPPPALSTLPTSSVFDLFFLLLVPLRFWHDVLLILLLYIPLISHLSSLLLFAFVIILFSLFPFRYLPFRISHSFPQHLFAFVIVVSTHYPLPFFQSSTLFFTILLSFHPPPSISLFIHLLPPHSVPLLPSPCLPYVGGFATHCKCNPQTKTVTNIPAEQGITKSPNNKAGNDDTTPASYISLRPTETRVPAASRSCHHARTVKHLVSRAVENVRALLQLFTL